MKLSEVKDVGKYYRIEFDGALEAKKVCSSDAEALEWFKKFADEMDEENASIGSLELKSPDGEVLKQKMVT